MNKYYSDVIFLFSINDIDTVDLFDSMYFLFLSLITIFVYDFSRYLYFYLYVFDISIFWSISLYKREVGTERGEIELVIEIEIEIEIDIKRDKGYWNGYY